ncbi:DUF3592 domain-containing protein [Dactylosporangium sp. NPDC051484]|uniref:DUF3592 domain-containing protein n=1 Tax=Dactylosporangium sp. NPDC051484 TaxID=3154942 RepID=UPI00344BF8B8
MANPLPHAAPSRLPALQSGAGIARLTGAILTPIALVMAGAAALVWVSLPAEPATDDWITLAVTAAFVPVLAGIGLPLLIVGARRLARLRRVLREGVPCAAVITAITGLSTDPDERGASRIDLAVPVPGGGTVNARVRQVVPLPLVRFVGPGVRVPVRVDPADPTVAVIDWRHAEPRERVAGAMAGSSLVDLAASLFG